MLLTNLGIDDWRKFVLSNLVVGNEEGCIKIPCEVRVFVVVNFDIKLSLNQLVVSVTTSQDCSVLANIILVICAYVEFVINTRVISEPSSA